jgi:uncharacterized membrane protein
MGDGSLGAAGQVIGKWATNVPTCRKGDTTAHSGTTASVRPPRFIVGQTILVAIWIILNAAAISLRWDPYPFILLNLAFSTQAAYAAPLILLAQTRQADRDKIRDTNVQAHREKEAEVQRAFEERESAVLAQEQEMAKKLAAMLEKNTALTEQVAALTEEVHATICRPE